MRRLLELGYYASITLAASDANELELDARPSDAVALALRAGAPIVAAEEVIDDCAIEIDNEQEEATETFEAFRSLLEDLKPEDFEDVNPEDS